MGEKDVSWGYSKHKVHSDKFCNKNYKVLWDKVTEQVLLFRLGGEGFTGWWLLGGGSGRWKSNI